MAKRKKPKRDAPVRAVAYCEPCDRLFDIPVSLTAGASLIMRDISARCPRCGTIGDVPNGVHSNVDGQLRIALESKTGGELRRMRRELEQLQQRRELDIDAIAQRVSALLPEAPAIEPKTWSRGDVMTYINTLLALIATIIAIRGAK